MLEGFQLAAITRSDKEHLLKWIPTRQSLQTHLAKDWENQLLDLIGGTTQIDFVSGYTPEDDELFRIKGYVQPDWLARERRESIPNLETISIGEDGQPSLIAFVAFALHDGDEVLLFQKFDRSKVVAPGRFMFLEGPIFQTMQQRGLILSSRLDAVILASSNTLLFRNFYRTNTLLPLADFYKEASNEQIREVLCHSHFAAIDVEAVVTFANQWARKRFAMIRATGILDKYTPEQIKGRSKGYNVNVKIKRGKIIFPSEKGEIRKLLQFLNEEIFRGPVSDTLYQTNSKRAAE